MAYPYNPENDRALVKKYISSLPTNIPTVSTSTAPPTLFQRLMGKRTLTGGKKRRTRIIKNSKKEKSKQKKLKKLKKLKLEQKKDN